MRVANFLGDMLGGSFIGVAAVVMWKAYVCCASTRAHLKLAFWLFLAGVAVLVVLVVIRAVMLRRRAHLPDHLVLGEQNWQLTEDGATQTTRLTESRLSWAAFLYRTEDKENHYLFLEPGEVILLPKAALSVAEVSILSSRIRSR